VLLPERRRASPSIDNLLVGLHTQEYSVRQQLTATFARN
jgi:hypothetical protein